MPRPTMTTDLCVPALLGGLLAALAGLVPAPVLANDRDLQATPVPPAACTEVSRSGFTDGFRTGTSEDACHGQSGWIFGRRSSLSADEAEGYNSVKLTVSNARDAAEGE